MPAAVERVVYREGHLEVGAFRCGAGRPDFDVAGQIRDHCAFVFPRTAVRIRHEGRPAFTAHAGVVAFYNPRQPYTRARLDPLGDHCEWFALDAGAAAEAVRERDPAAAERHHAPFRFTHGPSDAATYLAQRELFALLARGEGADVLAVEERVLVLLDAVLALAYAAGGSGRVPGRVRPRGREAAEAARDILARHFREALPLEALARAVSLSRFRLCRAFRAVTGGTLHAFREQLRLRAALGPLADGCDDLTGLALDLGYSSHSHFTASFRRAFAVTPSQARTRLRSRRRR
jgi:AraC-like DNA-binding protein